jgi:hypothetical protein
MVATSSTACQHERKYGNGNYRWKKTALILVARLHLILLVLLRIPESMSLCSDAR